MLDFWQLLVNVAYWDLHLTGGRTLSFLRAYGARSTLDLTSRSLEEVHGKRACVRACVCASV
eukprot:2352774-Amphidinium_carterae.1